MFKKTADLAEDGSPNEDNDNEDNGNEANNKKDNKNNNNSKNEDNNNKDDDDHKEEKNICHLSVQIIQRAHLSRICNLVMSSPLHS